MYAAWQNPNEAFKAMINPMTYVNMCAGMISWAGNLGNSLYEGDWSAAAFAGGELLGLGATMFARGGGRQMAMSLVKDSARVAAQGLVWLKNKLSDLGSRAMDILRDTSGQVLLPGGNSVGMPNANTRLKLATEVKSTNTDRKSVV